jgi:hypothetical protein
VCVCVCVRVCVCVCACIHARTHLCVYEYTDKHVHAMQKHECRHIQLRHNTFCVCVDKEEYLLAAAMPSDTPPALFSTPRSPEHDTPPPTPLALTSLFPPKPVGLRGGVRDTSNVGAAVLVIEGGGVLLLDSPFIVASGLQVSCCDDSLVDSVARDDSLSVFVCKPVSAASI